MFLASPLKSPIFEGATYFFMTNSRLQKSSLWTHVFQCCDDSCSSRHILAGIGDQAVV